MNKKIIALAVAAAFTAPMAAQAAVKVYGSAQVDFATHGGDLGAGTSIEDQGQGRIGLKGSEDLGNGLKAVYNLEYSQDTADGTKTSPSPLSARQAYLGLKGGFGEVVFGRVKTPYKYFGGVKYDPFNASTLQSRGAGGSTTGSLGQNSFQSDSVSYKVKSGAMTFWLAYDLDDGGKDDFATAAAASAFQGSGNILNAGFKFKQKSWEAGIAIVDNDAATAGGSYEATKLFGQWKSGAHKISAQTESVETGTTGEADYILLNYQLKMGKNVFTVSLGDTDANATYTGTQGAVDAEMTTIGLIHNMSKKTRVYVGYRTGDYSNSAGAGTVSSNTTAVGMRMKF